jgi:dTDP-4-amino-4,6-dideoxygalactose transaminase
MFEKDFASIYGSRHCIGVGNGTDSLFIIMKMLGIGNGDEVITVANSWISSSETITQTGAKPVFVDVDKYYTIDVAQIENKINSQTKGIIVVHLYGQMAAIDTIDALCKKYGLHLIEDCAQSHFSSYKGVLAGRRGIASSFSFYPGKNLGAYGDAGCILTDDNVLAEKCRMYANHGALVKHHHLIEGINSRLDGLQAAILLAKLPHIIAWTQSRIEKAALYKKYLSDIPQIELPIMRADSVHSYHLFVIKAVQRDALRNYLQKQGVNCEIHYPVILPLMPAYSYLKHEWNDFPNAAANQSQILSLPIYPELTEEQIKYVSESVHSFYNQYT